LTGVSWKRFLLRKASFFADGSHCAYTKPGINRPVIIPAYDEIGQDIILSNLRTAGISRESYFKRLEEI
jgi:hypothetical protein